MLSEMHVQGSWENDPKNLLELWLLSELPPDISSWMPHRHLGIILSLIQAGTVSLAHHENTQNPMQILKYWLDERTVQKQNPSLSTWKQFCLWVALSLISPSSLSSCPSVFLLLTPCWSASPLHSAAISPESILHALPVSRLSPPRLVSFRTLCHSSASWSKTPVVQHKLRLLCLAFRVHRWPPPSSSIIYSSSECHLLLPSWPPAYSSNISWVEPVLISGLISPDHTHLSSLTNPGFDFLPALSWESGWIPTIRPAPCCHA